MYEIKRANLFGTRFCPFCNRTSKLVQTTTYQVLPIRAKYRNFRTNLWAKLLKILLLTLIFWNWWYSIHGVANVIFESSQHLSIHFFACLPCQKASSFPEALVGSFSLAPAEILDSNISVVRHDVVTTLTFSLSQPKFSWSRNYVCSPRSTSFMRIFQVGSMFLSCLPVWYRPHTLIGSVLSLGWQTNIPSLKLFPNVLKLPFP